MKQTFFHIIIFLFLTCCKEVKQTDGKEIDSEKDSIETSSQDKSDSSNINAKKTPLAEIPEIVKVVYVTAKTGLVHRKGPSINSAKIGTYELGTKLGVIEETKVSQEIKDNGKTITGHWEKVVPMTFTSPKDYSRYASYIFNGFVIDSSKADFSKIPVYEREPAIRTELNGDKQILTFAKVTKEEFQKYKEEFDSKIILDSTKSYSGYGHSFIIKTSNRIFKYKSDIHSDQYIGYSPALRSFLILRTRQIGQLFIVDSLTSKTYELATAENGSRPIISDDETKFLVFSAQDYEGLTYISFYEREDKDKPFNYNKFTDYSTDKWLATDIVWINNNSIALKVNTLDDNGKNPEENVEYLKATME